MKTSNILPGGFKGNVSVIIPVIALGIFALLYAGIAFAWETRKKNK